MREKIFRILLMNLDLDQSDIISNLEKESISNWDSIRHLMIISDIEAELNISFTPDEIEQIKDLDSLLLIIKDKLEVNE